MCGIAGILNIDGRPVPAGEPAAMISAMAHRGPDGEGIWREGNVAIGHRRLSIIDPEGGRQPMANEDESVWITYNGELYNFLELRKGLEDRGHRFRTRSDTEVIVHAYEEWGDACVARFRGMFAFGIVDRENRRIFLARDHFGIKPLLYYSDPRRFSFASEMQALRCLENADLGVDLRAMDQYLWLQYIPAPRSIFRRVRKLPPAHRMSVDFDGRITGPERYWALAFRPDHGKTESDFEAELDAVLRDSVKAHLVSDVPFGAFLSGGVDSSAVVAYMAGIMERPVKTFSIGFEEPEYDELPHAAEAARRWGTDHTVEVVKPDALGILPRLVQSYGEPFGDSSAIPTYHVSRLARRHVPMVLSGDGGDETFAGYQAYARWMDYLHAPPPPDARPGWRKALDAAAGRLGLRTETVRRVPGKRLADWLQFINYLPVERRRELWRREHRAVVDAPLDVLEDAFAESAECSEANRVQFMDFRSYLPNCILPKVDIASMMVGLEVRTPIVDAKVMEFAATIPERMNIRRDETGRWEGKLLLKKVMERYYPRDHLTRAKKGFSVPIRHWFSRDGALHQEVRRRLSGPGSRLRDYFVPEAVGRLIDENHFSAIWLLLFLEEWLRQCDGPVRTP